MHIAHEVENYFTCRIGVALSDGHVLIGDISLTSRVQVEVSKLLPSHLKRELSFLQILCNVCRAQVILHYHRQLTIWYEKMHLG